MSADILRSALDEVFSETNVAATAAPITPTTPTAGGGGVAGRRCTGCAGDAPSDPTTACCPQAGFLRDQVASLESCVRVLLSRVRHLESAASASAASRRRLRRDSPAYAATPPPPPAPLPVSDYISLAAGPHLPADDACQEANPLTAALPTVDIGFLSRRARLDRLLGRRGAAAGLLAGPPPPQPPPPQPSEQPTPAHRRKPALAPLVVGCGDPNCPANHKSAVDLLAETAAAAAAAAGPTPSPQSPAAPPPAVPCCAFYRLLYRSLSEVPQGGGAGVPRQRGARQGGVELSGVACCEVQVLPGGGRRSVAVRDFPRAIRRELGEVQIGYVVDLTDAPLWWHPSSEALQWEAQRLGFNLLQHDVLPRNATVTHPDARGEGGRTSHHMGASTSLVIPGDPACAVDALTQIFAAVTPAVFAVPWGEIRESCAVPPPSTSLPPVDDRAKYLQSGAFSMLCLYDTDGLEHLTLTRPATVQLRETTRKDCHFEGTLTWLDGNGIAPATQPLVAAVLQDSIPPPGCRVSAAESHPVEKGWRLILLCRDTLRWVASIWLHPELHPTPLVMGHAPRATVVCKSLIQSHSHAKGSLGHAFHEYTLERMRRPAAPIPNYMTILLKSSKVPGGAFPRSLPGARYQLGHPCLRVVLSAGRAVWALRISETWYSSVEHGEENISISQYVPYGWWLVVGSTVYASETLCGMYYQVEREGAAPPGGVAMVEAVAQHEGCAVSRCVSCLAAVDASEKGGGCSRCSRCGGRNIRGVAQWDTSAPCTQPTAAEAAEEVMRDPSGIAFWNLWIPEVDTVYEVHTYTLADGTVVFYHPPEEGEEEEEEEEEDEEGADPRRIGGAGSGVGLPRVSVADHIDGVWGSELRVLLYDSMQLTLCTALSKFDQFKCLVGTMRDATGTMCDIVMTPRATERPHIPMCYEGSDEEKSTTSPSDCSEQSTYTTGDDADDEDDEYLAEEEASATSETSNFLGRARETVTKLVTLLLARTTIPEDGLALKQRAADVMNVIDRRAAGHGSNGDVKGAIADLLNLSRRMKPNGKDTGAPPAATTATPPTQGEQPSPPQGDAHLGRTAAQTAVPTPKVEGPAPPPAKDAKDPNSNPQLRAIVESNRSRRERCQGVKERVQAALGCVGDTELAVSEAGVAEMAVEDDKLVMRVFFVPPEGRDGDAARAVKNMMEKAVQSVAPACHEPSRPAPTAAGKPTKPEKPAFPVLPSWKSPIVASVCPFVTATFASLAA